MLGVDRQHVHEVFEAGVWRGRRALSIIAMLLVFRACLRLGDTNTCAHRSSWVAWATPSTLMVGWLRDRYGA